MPKKNPPTNTREPSQKQLDGRAAGKAVRDQYVDIVLKSKETSLQRIALRMGQALDAKHVKSQLNLQTGKWSYSKPMADNVTRVKALALVSKQLGLEVTKLEHAGADGITLEMIVKSYKEDEEKN